MYADVLVPGVWWHPLTYRISAPAKIGSRVLVPMGPRDSKRLGFLSAIKENIENKIDYEVKEVIEILDDVPLLGQELWSLSEWTSRQYLCSQGEILKLMCPTPIIEGSKVNDIPPLVFNPPKDGDSEHCVYEVYDNERYGRYREIIGEGKCGLIFFPEESVARTFWNDLPEDIKKQGLLWPSGGGKKAFEAWLKARRGEVSFLVGSVGLLFAPLTPIKFIVVEEDASFSYNLARYPNLSLRHVAAKRAQMWKAKLILGGRLPSSRLYLLKKPKLSKNVKEQIRFVNIKTANKIILPGISQGLPISSSLLKSSLEVVNRGEVAMWILDRKGYAGEISCEECGWTFVCSHCGSICRINENIVICPFCGKRYEMPTICPSCMSRLLTGKRPGLEALHGIAQALAGDVAPVYMWYKEKSGKKRKTAMLQEIGKGGLVVGSRLALSLCDDCNVGLIGWIDADAETWRPNYNARFMAFSMMWESRFRGINPKSREVIIQSRRPYHGWQRGLKDGWNFFWEDELKERYELNFPPFTLLIEISAPIKVIEDIFLLLDKSGFAVYKPIADEGIIWVKAKDARVLRELLKPYFHISRSKIGFPKIRIWRD